MAAHEGFDGFDLHPQLAFVVDRSPRIKIVIALGRLKGRRDPLVQGIGRLHIIMGITKGGGFSRSVQPVGINQRVAFGRKNLDVLHADAPQFTGDILRRFLHI